jgi:predicted nuclease of predicted toxin-antitoxin system
VNLLADVNIEWAVVHTLRADGHDVRWLAEGIIERRLKDPLVMEIAHREGRVILTSDREFVNYVFRDRLFTYGVVLLRVALDRAPYPVRTQRACDAVRTYQERLRDHFTIIYPDHIEQIPLSPRASSPEEEHGG